MSPVAYHSPVLAETVARWASDRRRIVDGTVGGGGHLAGFVAAGARILAVDRDPDAIAAARRRVGEDGVTYLPGAFGDPYVLTEIARFGPDLIFLDLGVSSWQLDRDARGFSFRPGVPLDMRMDGKQERTAATVLNGWTPSALARLFRESADEPRARSLARVIERRRAIRPLTTADDLVNATREALGARSGPSDFARIFQAVRIAVNDEIEHLRSALPSLRDALTPDGLLVVITYHSGEDREVKRAFRAWGASCICPPRQPVCTCRGVPLGVVETRKPIRATDDEIAANSRARSAKLRVFRTAHDA